MLPKFPSKAKIHHKTGWEIAGAAKANTLGKQSILTSYVLRIASECPGCVHSAQQSQSSSSTHGRRRSLKSKTPDTPPPQQNPFSLSGFSANNAQEMETNETACPPSQSECSSCTITSHRLLRTLSPPQPNH